MDLVDTQNGLLCNKVASNPSRCGSNLPPPQFRQYENWKIAFNSEEFWKKGEHLLFFHIEIVLGISMAQESSETYSLQISKAPSLGSFIFVQYSAGILCPLSFAMEFDTFLFGFWNQLCEHTTHTDLRPWALSPLCLGNHYLKLRIQNKLYGKQIGKKPPTQVI